MRFSGLLMVGAVALSACGEKQAIEPADLVLTGGTIYTVDAGNHVATAMAVRGGAIVYVGDDLGAQAYVADGTDARDLGGKAVFPGFTDSHAHVAGGGSGLLGLSLVSHTTADEVVAAAKAYADAHPDLPVIFGAGWELNLFPDANPHKDLLDAVIPDRPVILVAADGHNAWVNSKAFEVAGVTAATADPLNGRLERDAEGNPTGTLREAAQSLVLPIVPEPTVADTIAALEAGMQFQASHGITASIDASVAEDAEEQAYLAAAARADLPARLRVSLLAAPTMVTSIVTEENATAVVERLKERREAFRAASKGRVDAEAVKIFVDGVFENYTAAMIDPYVGTPFGPTHRGDMNLSADALKAYVTALDSADFQVHMHALGDQAVRSGLDAVEAAAGANGAKDRRHHLAHLEIVNPADIPRFAALNATANLQTLWHFRDAYITDLTEPYLREDLHRWLYPAKSFRDAGVRIVWGSDWPVSTSDVFDSIEAAVLRKDPHDAASTPLVAEEALTIDDMIRALTVNGAYLMNQENLRGSLETGKRADFIIVDADPYKVAPEDISEIEVLETYVDGARVYARGQ